MHLVTIIYAESGTINLLDLPKILKHFFIIFLFVCSPAGQRVRVAIWSLTVSSVMKWGYGVQSLYKTSDHYRVQKMRGF